jgi:hypothetical protein
MISIKIHPLTECNICYDKKIVFSCLNKKCDFKICKKCLIKYQKKICPACRKEDSFKIIEDTCCNKLKKNIITIIKNQYYKIKIYFENIITIVKMTFHVIKENFLNIKCPQSFYNIIILFLLLFGGSVISENFFHKETNLSVILWISYAFLGFLFLIFLLVFTTILFISCFPLYFM